MACFAPAYEDIKPDLDLPTPAPTSLPPEAPTGEALPTPEAPAKPLVITAEAEFTSFGSSPQDACNANGSATLQITSTGQAVLSATGPNFVDHINCNSTDTQETWIFEGTADTTSEVATFTGCNYGGFDGGGRVTYQAGELAGELTCNWKDGSPAVRILFSPRD